MKIKSCPVILKVMDVVEEIKQRLNIEDVISEYVQLKRAGRNFKGLSPFTNERTPSFIVSPEKQIWHDFSSGRGGNMFSFVMEMEGLDFKGTLELLARKAGVDLEQYRGRQDGYSAKLKARVLEILELATKFYQAQLKANRSALNYIINNRGLTKETVIAWQIGYSPNTGRALTEFLTRKGFTVEEMKRSGLATERRHGIGDMFRGRIMVPLCDSQGKVIGFTARLLADEPDSPKYINTPQTIVYDKSRQVFGLHFAKEQIRKTGFVVVVEGNLDVITAHQAGTRNVVATAGTAITEQHLKALSRFSGDIRLCFDSDRAGIEAAERAIPLAQKAGVQLSVIALIDAKDPDELIRKDVHLWQTALDTHQYATDWLITQLQTKYDVLSASGKKDFTDAILPTISRLSDPVEKEHYLKLVGDVTETSIEALKMKLGGSQKTTLLKKPKVDFEGATDENARQRHMVQDNFLALILMVPKLRTFLKGMKTSWFEGEHRQQIFKFIKENPKFDGDPKVAKDLKNITDYVKILSLQYEELYDSLDKEDLSSQAEHLRRRLIDRYVKDQKQILVKKIKTSSNEDELEKLVTEVDRLNQLIR